MIVVRRGSDGALSLMVAVLLAVVSVAVTSVLSSAAGRPAHAAVGDIGVVGPSFTGVSNPPTSDKPQSKLWYNDGTWWADMFDTGSRTWRIFRLDRGSQTWVDTGTMIDNRPESLADTLWDGTHLYVASHYVTVSSDVSPKASLSNRPARLYRFSYSPSARTYTLDAGYPVQINNNSSESLTLDKDSTGQLWATWTQVSGSSDVGFTSSVYLNSTTGGDAVWGTPMVLPVEGAAVAPDDISAVVAYGRSRIGVLWSNHLYDTVYWATHRDGAGPEVWVSGVAVRGQKQSDDHLNLKTLQADASGRVYAAVKTSADEIVGAAKSTPQVNLLVFKPGTGAWTSHTFGTLADCHTRPIVMLDEERSEVHMFATAPTSSGCAYTGAPGTIYHKSAAMDEPTFSVGRGTPVIRDAASENVNNATSSKQGVGSRTGLVVLASNMATSRYWHADMPLLAASPSPTPAATIVQASTSTTANTTASNELVLGTPAGTSAGDVLVSCVTLNGTSIASNGVPEGWTLLAAGTGVSNPRVYGYYKVAGVAEPSSYRWSLSSAVTSGGGIARYTGTSGPDAPASKASGASAFSGTVPEVTTTSAGSMLVGCVGINSAATSVSITSPTGMDEAWDIGGKRHELASGLQAAAGPSGGKTWAFSASREWSGWLVALRPN